MNRILACLNCQCMCHTVSRKDLGKLSGVVFEGPAADLHSVVDLRIAVDEFHRTAGRTVEPCGEGQVHFHKVPLFQEVASFLLSFLLRTKLALVLHYLRCSSDDFFW